jgi:hypothetical protein
MPTRGTETTKVVLGEASACWNTGQRLRKRARWLIARGQSRLGRLWLRCAYLTCAARVVITNDADASACFCGLFY